MHLLIIISVLNNSSGLLRSFLSLQLQNCSNFTLRIQDPLDQSSSSSLFTLLEDITFSLEVDHTKDNGISHSFNIALLNTQSLWSHALFLGAGDTLATPNAVSLIYEVLFLRRDCFLHAFAVNRTSMSGNVYYIDNPQKAKWFQLAYKNIFPHQGLVTSKQFFELYGLFSQQCIFSMDYELLLRSFRSFPTYSTHGYVVSNWIEGGIGTGKTILVLAEYCRNRSRSGAFSVFTSRFIYLLSILSLCKKKFFTFIKILVWPC